jgi:hypothetical protein
MVFFDKCGLYVQSQTTLQAKIIAIDAIIQALEDSALLIAGGGDAVSEYQLNDGQTIIKQVYRGSAAISKAINDYEIIKQLYVNRLNGRVVRSIDSKNFRNSRGTR